jgi:hypothetical protein
MAPLFRAAILLIGLGLWSGIRLGVETRLVGVPLSDEHRAKLSASHRARWNGVPRKPRKKPPSKAKPKEPTEPGPSTDSSREE